MSSRFILKSFLIIAVGALCIVGHAQTQPPPLQADVPNSADNVGAVVLVVTDQSAAVVPRSEVRLVPTPAGLNEKLSPDNNGRLALEIPAGSYDFSITASGFFTARKHVEVTAGSRQTVRTVLQVDSCPQGPCYEVTAPSLLSPDAPRAVESL